MSTLDIFDAIMELQAAFRNENLEPPTLVLKSSTEGVRLVNAINQIHKNEWVFTTDGPYKVSVKDRYANLCEFTVGGVKVRWDEPRAWGHP